MDPAGLTVPSLDAVSLCVALSVVGFLMSAISASMARAAPDHRRALRTWSGAMAAVGGAFGLFALRGHAPLVLTFVLANALALLITGLVLLAYAQLFSVAVPRRAVRILLFAGMLLPAAGHAGLVPLHVAAGVTSFIGGTMLLGAAAAAARPSLSSGMVACVLGTAATAATGALFLARVGIAWGDPPTATSLIARSSAHLGPVVLTAFVFVVTASMGFFAYVHEQQRQRAIERARRDGLTGTYTRSAFFELAARVEGRCAVLMIDIDHFRDVNERYGHRGGDLTLAHAARLMMSAVRIDDLVGRYGGEEFCIVLRGCGAAEAAALAERLVSEARATGVRLPDGRSVGYTLSAGYADRAPGESVDDALDRADAALYRAKRAGRNRAVPAMPAVLRPAGA